MPYGILKAPLRVLFYYDLSAIPSFASASIMPFATSITSSVVRVLSGFDWEVEGDFLAHEYEIYRGDYAIATISKEWFTWGDTYSIDIAEGVDPVPIISVVLIIDAILAQNNARITLTIG